MQDCMKGQTFLVAVVYGGKDQGTSKNMVSISPHLYRIYAVMKFEYGLLFMT